MADATVTQDGLVYTLSSDSSYYSVKWDGTTSITTANISSSISGIPVTSIDVAAFANCSTLTSIIIPDSVTSIGRYVFSNCNSLTSITVDTDNTVYKSEENCIIKKATNILIFGCKASIIPNDVTTIGEYAFRSCSGLTSITIPDSVTTIENYAFEFCTSLTDVTIGNSVRTIGNNAFNGCTSLTDVTIPDNVTSIGECVFRDCSALESVTIGNNVTSIDYQAFYNCSKLTSINIPEGVTFIGYQAFYKCIALESINIPDSVTSIHSYAFSGCTSLTDFTLNSTTAIPESSYVFDNCDNLTEVKYTQADVYTEGNTWNGKTLVYSGPKQEVIQDGLVYTLSDDSSYYSVKVENDSITTAIISPEIYGIPVTTIESRAFYNCALLTDVTIPNSIISIGEYVFSSCSALTSITVDTDNTVYKSKENCIIEKATDTLIAGCKTSIIPNDVTSIGEYAFHGCSGLTSITIPDGVTSIGVGAFEYCSGLTSIIIPDSITSIEERTFNGCSALTSINIPDGVTSIGSDAFGNCSKLASINIPDGVTSIENGTFDHCSALTSINIPDGVTSIGYSAFRNCIALTSINIPDSVAAIRDWAFQDCTSLTDVTIGNGVTSIGDYAFSSCSELTDFTLNSTTAIPETTDVFYGCDALIEVKYTNSNAGYVDGETWNGKTLVYDGTIVITLSPESITTTYNDVSNKTITVSVEGGSLTDVTVDYATEITGSAWVSQQYDSSTGVITLSISENTTVDERTQDFIVTCGNVSKQFTVTQTGIVVIDIEPESLTFDHETSSKTVAVTLTNAETFDITWDYIVNNWVLVTSSNGIITVTVSANETLEQRSSDITISANGITKILTVNQTGIPNLRLSKTSLNVSSETTTDNSIVITPVFCDITDIDIVINDNDSWITSATINDSGVLSLTFNMNVGADERFGTITFSVGDQSETLTIVQSGRDGINSIKIGNLELSKIMVGQSEVSKVLLGNYIMVPNYDTRIERSTYNFEISGINNEVIDNIASYTYNLIDIDNSGTTKTLAFTSSNGGKLWSSTDVNCTSITNTALLDLIASASGISADIIKTITHGVGYGRAGNTTVKTITGLTPYVPYVITSIIKPITGSGTLTITKGSLVMAIKGSLLTVGELSAITSGNISLANVLNGVIIKVKADANGEIALSVNNKPSYALTSITRNRCDNVFNTNIPTTLSLFDFDDDIETELLSTEF